MTLSAEAARVTLREALKRVMRERDAALISAVRELIGAIDNAEAVAIDTVPAGVSEVAPRQLSEAEVAALIERDLSERREAAQKYEALGRPDEAARLYRQIEFLQRLTS